MKAAVLTEINAPLRIVELEQAPPKAGEARVKVKATGVCMSDWHIMNGDWPSKLPIVPGHEAAGIVAEVGPGVTRVKPGDHVIFSFRPHCGHCRYCATGRSVLCIGHADTPGWVQYDGTTRLAMNGTAVNQMARIGTFGESVVCSEENLVRIRDDMPWAQAALVGCSVATGVGAVVRHAKVRPGSSVLVIGCGGVGLNIVQGARLAGAMRIIAADLLPNKLAYAKAFGATDAIDAKSENVVKRVREMTGLGVDYAFDAIGSEVTTAQIVDAVAPGGAAVMVGIPGSTVTAPISPFRMVFQEKSLSGSFYGSVQPNLDFPILCDPTWTRSSTSTISSAAPTGSTRSTRVLRHCAPARSRAGSCCSIEAS
jgi:S-(hydroxymethyl)glutathione dehydrogenase / alcohol dehydrogenase